MANDQNNQNEKKPEEKQKKRFDSDLIKFPEVVVDPTTKRCYKTGDLLGRGGFAKCHEMVDMATKRIYAGKAVCKDQLKTADHKNKMAQEIDIHRSLRHRHIVGFHTYFEDDKNIYIILELCSSRSLMEMHKRRKTLTVPEIRYMTRQIALGVEYLHNRRIIHRDLKLGNIFLDEQMEVKIGDFGLATRLMTFGERKTTMCGTPNYIAPEVLNRNGHSYEVDIWSLGCIVYTLAFGKPPFEDSQLELTYKRIQSNDFEIPHKVNEPLCRIIKKMLRHVPKERPTIKQILADRVFDEYIPSRLPRSCLVTKPRCDTGRLSIMPDEDPSRKPFSEKNHDAALKAAAAADDKQLPIATSAGNKQTPMVAPTAALAANSNKDNVMKPHNNHHLHQLSGQLNHVLGLNIECKGSENGAEDPKASPIFWISKWVDYTDKYGVGYQLSDNSIGVLFNDNTRIVLLADGHNVQYIERDGTEAYHTLENRPADLNKKVTLLTYFRNYMNEHLLKLEKSSDSQKKKLDVITRLPYLANWYRTRNAIVFHLTNGTVQINFFPDHTKIILCPLMGAVTYINEHREFHTYSFNLIEIYGASKDVLTRLKYAKEVVDRLMVHKSGGQLKSTPTAAAAATAAATAAAAATAKSKHTVKP